MPDAFSRWPVALRTEEVVDDIGAVCKTVHEIRAYGRQAADAAWSWPFAIAFQASKRPDAAERDPKWRPIDSAATVAASTRAIHAAACAPAKLDLHCLT